MSDVDIDDFTEDFDGALDALAKATIARVERETAGMTDAQIADYWLDSAKRHLAEVRRLDAPECIIEMAEQRVARSEAKRDALRKS